MRKGIKNKLLRFFLMLMLGVFLVPGTSSASAFLNNWYIDLDANGTGGKIQITEFLDTVGSMYAINTFANPGDTTGTFANYGAFSSVQHDSGPYYYVDDATYTGYEITSKFTAGGDIDLTGGILGFTTGTMDLYIDDSADFGSTNSMYGADNGVHIATLNLLSGDGTVNPSGVPNGEITTIWEFTMLKKKYLFQPDGTTDIAKLNPITLLLGYGTTNASYVATPTQNAINEIAGEFAGVPVTDPWNGDTPDNQPPDDLFMGGNGQFRVAVVPEPATMFLLGSGLIGLAGLSRRKFFKK